MKYLLAFIAITMLLLPSFEIFAQQGTPEPSTGTREAAADVAYWVAYWAKPKVVIFGPEEDAFNNNMHDIMFPWDDHSGPLNPNVLDDNVQWLKDHANNRFYIDGYASSRGGGGYNLRLSNKRADCVKQTLISKGIPENQIVMAVGWGEAYPVCAKLNAECWSKNRVVRFVYAPH
jgi:outer membrane protein OmpA-like peptidoglycan-associated protein